uniref:Methyltransferase domain-containing protein n=1 Tax=Alexandrium monilatum TaxID=311494 RepID=A0A7S4Q0I8_9DINO|mmetsp:Transcript_101317/g.312483  ORF Transcript_101317/g.312483 Transcript_101317/m.312483 type:complete len:339 (-) Transcript_101317:94-1110(-)
MTAGDEHEGGLSSLSPAPTGPGAPGQATPDGQPLPPPPEPIGHRRRQRTRKDALDGLLAGRGALPRRASTLDPKCMLGRLSRRMAEAVTSYSALAFGAGSDEVALCFAAAAEACPDGLRVKELLESLEAYREIAAFAHDARKRKPLGTIYDMACGHGLLGLLFAYRFPDVNVVCVDTSKRPVFDALVRGFRLHGVALGGEAEPLSNLRFEEADALSLRLPPGSMVVAVHACNELNRRLLDAAAAAGATWAVLPCCIRAGTYLPCRVGGALKDDDDVTHTLNCGVVAGIYKAERVQTIDRRITNRNVVICGGVGIGDYAEACQLSTEGHPGSPPAACGS